MKIVSLILCLLISNTILLSQRLGFEQQTYDKEKLTVTGGSESYFWKALEGERRISESEFWKLIGEKQLSNKTSTTTHEGEKIVYGVFVGMMSLGCLEWVVEPDQTKQGRWTGAAFACVGFYLTYKIFAKKYKCVVLYDSAKAAADRYNDSLRTALQLPK